MFSIINEGDGETSSRCYTFASKGQFWTNIVIHTLGLIIVILTFHWAGDFKAGYGWEGHAKYIWHPTFMVLGGIYFYGFGMSAFRLIPIKRDLVKILHICLLFGTVVCMTFALIAIVVLRNEGGKSHIVSFHSWLGLIAMILLYLQWPLSLAVYFLNWSTPRLRALLMPWHRKMGMVIFIFILAALVTGYQKYTSGKSTAGTAEIIVIGILTVLYFILQTILVNDDWFKFNQK